MIQREAKQQDKEVLMELTNNVSTKVTLHNGKTVNVGWILPITQDKLDGLIVEYEAFKNSLKPISHEEGQEPVYSDRDINRGNKRTRQFYAQCVAAILLNSYWGLKFRWWLKWRLLYNFGKFNGSDYLSIITEAKKKAQEQQYSLAMLLLMDMTTTWTTMTKKEAEEYRHELELAKEAQLLRSSQA